MRSILAIGLLAIVSSTACGRMGFAERVSGDVSEDAAGDAAGNALAVTPQVAHTNLNSKLSFTAANGEPPYTFALVRGTGDLDASTGWFRAPDYPGTALVEVRDAAGAVASAEISFGGDALYAVGSFVSNVAKDVVWRSGDGIAWQQVGTLPAARGGGALFVLDDKLIYAGGADGPEGASFADVWSSGDGISWTAIGQLPMASYGSAFVVFRGRLWLLGGRTADDDFSQLVWSSADGASWQVEAPLTVGLHGGRAAVFEDAIWLVAGHEEAQMTKAVWMQHADGSWVDVGSVPLAGEYHGVTVRAGALWVAGGLGLDDRVVTTTDGTTWSDSPRLPTARNYSTLLEWQNAMWVIGGIPRQTWRAVTNDPWSTVGSFPVNDEGTSVVQFTPQP